MRYILFNGLMPLLLLLTLIPTISLAGDKGVQDLLKNARVQFFDKDYDAALQTFNKALAIQPNNMEAQLGKMDTLGALRRPAANLAKSVSVKQTAPTEALILGANEKIWKRDFKGALTDLEKALTKDPKSYIAHYLSAFLQRRSRKFDSALTHLKKAYELAPDFPETSYLLGDVYMAKGQTDNALLAFQRYLEMVPARGKRYETVTATIRRIGG